MSYYMLQLSPPEIVFRAVILQQMDDEHLSGYAKWVASKLDEDI